MKAASKNGTRKPKRGTRKPHTQQLSVRDQKLLSTSAEPRHIVPAVGGSRIKGTAGKGKGKQKKPKKHHQNKTKKNLKKCHKNKTTTKKPKQTNKRSEFSIFPILKQSANSGNSPWQAMHRGFMV